MPLFKYDEWTSLLLALLFHLTTAYLTYRYDIPLFIYTFCLTFDERLV